MKQATAEEQRTMDLMSSMASEAWSGEIATSFANENEPEAGTSTNPYKITNSEELAYFVETVNGGNTLANKTIEIVNNINMEGKKIVPAGKGQIGSKEENAFVQTTTYFEGVLDGKNNTIANLSINEIDMHGVGLIGVLEEAGEIKNLTIYNGNITGRAAIGAGRGKITTGTSSAGGIVGQQIGNTVISICNNRGELNFSFPKKIKNFQFFFNKPSL